MRPRRSGRGGSGQAGRAAPRVIAVVLVLSVLAGAGYAAVHVLGFLHSVANLGNPVQLVRKEVEPPVGSVAWKLKHGQRVNVLALGFGGAENNAPWLTDSIMAVTIDPASHRILETSIPRDLYVRIDAWQDGRAYSEKINAAFEVPNEPRLFGPGPLKPAFQGKDGAGHLVEATVGRVTGLTFDKYAAVDFKAFREVVDTLGGVQVHLDVPLDDCHYPDYNNGYMNHGVPPGYRCPPGAGIHFPAGDQVVSGEQALELARSRDAIEPEQATDFGRAKRQQAIVAAIKKKATSVGGLARAPQLMDVLQNNFETDMDLTDMQALYSFTSKLPDSSIEHLAITDQDLVADYAPYTRGSCGPRDAFVLCPEDPTYRMMQAALAHAFVDRKTLAEQAPVQLVNASYSSADLQVRATSVLRAFGFQLGDGVRRPAVAKTIVYDYTGGRYPATAAWLQEFFGAELDPVSAPSPGTRASPLPAPGQQTEGLVVVMGTDFARRWYGLA